MKQWMKKWLQIILPIGILAAGLLGAFVLVVSKPDVETRPAEKHLPVVQVQTMQKQAYEVMIKSQGNVVPRTESALVAQVSGRVVGVAPSFVTGGFFEKGDVLVTIDRRDYELAVTQAKAQVAQAELRLKLEQQEAEVARKEWQRLGKGEAPALVAREPQVAEAAAALAAARARLEQAELDLERTLIRAPYAGRIRAKSVDVGQFINRGSPVAMVYAVDYVEVRLPLPDEDLAFLNMPFDFRGSQALNRGPRVTLSANFAGRESEWQGYIHRLEGEIDPRSRMVHAVARVDNPYGDDQRSDRPPLTVGLFVNATISGQTIDSVYVVPRAALRGHDRVLIVDNDDRIQFRQVEVQRRASDYILVSRGLQQGERVCLSQLEAVVDGMQVRTLTDATVQAKQASREGTQ